MSQVHDRISPSIPKAIVPPLQNGDRLTRAEFERRFDATPGLTKAELIQGRVYVPPAVSLRGHSGPHLHLAGLIMVYAAATPGVTGADNGSVRLDLQNMPQPDIFLFIESSHGGQSRVDGDDYLKGAPELVAEIAATTASYDLHEKLEVYVQHGVREYIVWRTLDHEFDHFVSRDGAFQRQAATTEGILKSAIFPGLQLDTRALIAGNLSAALVTVQQGIGSGEHSAFVELLKQRALPEEIPNS